MLHLDVDKRHQHRTCAIEQSVVGIDIVYDDRLERTGKLLDVVFVVLRAVALLYTLKLTYLEGCGLHILGSGGLAIHFYAEGIACGGVYIAVHVLHVNLLHHLAKRLNLCATVGVFDIVVVGIVIAHAVAHVVALIFLVALATILYTHTKYLLSHLAHR